MPQDPPLFGIGFRANHFDDLLASGPQDVNFLEIMTENYLHHGRAKKTFLDNLAEKWTLSLHGVGMSIGGFDPLNLSYLESLDLLAKRLRPKFMTDHLCWTSFHGHNTHDLLPLPYTDESLRHVVSRVQYVQERLRQRLYLENPSAYTAFHSSTMEEAEFLASLCKESGCGILLDVNNLYVAHRNLGIDPGLYLAKLDPSTIGYLHMAGHTDQGDVLIDTHDHPVTDNVMDLYRTVICLFAKAPTILEWDGDVPPYAVMIDHLNKIKECVDQDSLLPQATLFENITSACNARTYHARTGYTTPVKDIQEQFFHLVTSTDPRREEDLIIQPLLDSAVPTPATLGLKVYRDAYWMRLTKVIRSTYPCLESLIGAKKFKELIFSYLQEYPPSEPDIKFAGQYLAKFLTKYLPLADLEVSPKLLSDIGALEWAKYDALDDSDPVTGISLSHLRSITAGAWPYLTIEFNPQIRVVKSDWAISEVLVEFTSGKVPSKPKEIKSAYLVIKAEDDVQILNAGWSEFRLFEKLKEGLPFEKALVSCYDRDLLEDDVSQGVMWLSEWCASGLISALHHEESRI